MITWPACYFEAGAGVPLELVELGAVLGAVEELGAALEPLLPPLFFSVFAACLSAPTFFARRLRLWLMKTHHTPSTNLALAPMIRDPASREHPA